MEQVDDFIEEPEPRELPPVPTYSLTGIDKMRKHISDTILFPFYGCPMVGEVFQEACFRVSKYLKLDHKSSEAVAVSLQPLLGKELSVEAARAVAWRVAGNAGLLRKGTPVLPWSVQRTEEWVPVQVTAGRRLVQKKGRSSRSGWTYVFSVLAGSAVGMDIRQWWSSEKAGVVFSVIGFSRKPPYIRESMAELVGMRFMVLLEPKLSDRGPGFYHVHCSGSTQASNRAVIKMRRRIDFECPEGYTHPCHRCHIGARECPASTHRHTYQPKFCTGCGREWWFDTDPRFVNDYCVHCQPRSDSGLSLGSVFDTPEE